MIMNNEAAIAHYRGKIRRDLKEMREASQA